MNAFRYLAHASRALAAFSFGAFLAAAFDLGFYPETAAGLLLSAALFPVSSVVLRNFPAQDGER